MYNEKHLKYLIWFLHSYCHLNSLLCSWEDVGDGHLTVPRCFSSCLRTGVLWGQVSATQGAHQGPGRPLPVDRVDAITQHTSQQVSVGWQEVPHLTQLRLIPHPASNKLEAPPPTLEVPNRKRFVVGNYFRWIWWKLFCFFVLVKLFSCVAWNCILVPSTPMLSSSLKKESVGCSIDILPVMEPLYYLLHLKSRLINILIWDL